MAIAQYVDLGTTDYVSTIGLQEGIVRYMQNVDADVLPDTVLLTEHNPCIVFGRDKEKNRFSDAFLESLEGKNPEGALGEMGISFSRFGFRGGASYVGPGQIVVYPVSRYLEIVTDDQSELKVSGYKRLIDRTMLSVMEAFEIEQAYIAQGFSQETQRDRRDVWIDRDGQSYKIGAKGIRLAGGVAYHGFQIYVNRSGLEHFDKIHPCGYRHDEVGVISMQDMLGRELDMEDVKAVVLDAIRKNFGYDDIRKIDAATLLSAVAEGPPGI